MSGPYSLDLRERVVGCIRAGHSCRAAAARYEVSVASAVRWAQRERDTGSCAAKKMGGRRVKLAAHRAWLVERLMGKRVTLEQLRAELAAIGVRVSYGALWRFVHAEGLSFPEGGPARRRAGPQRRRSAARAVAQAPGQG
jgi:putative transposase